MNKFYLCKKENILAIGIGVILILIAFIVKSVFQIKTDLYGLISLTFILFVVFYLRNFLKKS